MSKASPNGGERGIVFRLAGADLRHEWILTICLIMAIAAVLSPLLLLFGLKYGTIETLRYRLVQDPRNREIRPMVSKSFTRDWFDQLRKRPDVAFVVPTTRAISASVDVTVKGKVGRDSLDLIPTSQGDPLLVENGAPVPEADQCVITQSAAQDLDAQVGDTLVITTKRRRGSQYESASLELKLAGILNPRAGTLKRLYVLLEVMEAVESYKDGRAVPLYNWPGTTAAAYPVYDGLVIVVPAELNKLDQVMLINNTGFSRIGQAGPQMAQQLGFSVGVPMNLYLLSTKTKPVDQQSLQMVQERLRGKGATLLPFIWPLGCRLLDQQGQGVTQLEVVGLSAESGLAQELKISPLPPWGQGLGSTPELLKIMLPQGLEVPSGPLSLELTKGKEVLRVPVSPVDQRGPQGQRAYLPSTLAGMLNLFKLRNITFQKDPPELLLARRGYAGFRLYAATIDDVPLLKKYMEQGSIPVHTQAERIRDVTELNTYLTLIFWLIAVVGIVGGMASLLASLYASVERKKRELSVLRLIGLSGAKLLRFPIYQGMLIAAGGYLVAMSFFQVLALTINRLFAQHLQKGESFCTLPIGHALAAAAATILIAMLAASLAAWRATRIEPAEALRDE